MNGIMDYFGQNFGFSWRGLLAAGLLMLPNLLFAVRSPKSMPANLQSAGAAVEILENGSRIATLAGFVLLTKQGHGSPLFLGLGLAALTPYYGMWIRYFFTNRPFASLFTEKFWGMPLPMAVFPVLFFFFMALWLESLPLVGIIAVFGVCHLWNSYATLKQLQ